MPIDSKQANAAVFLLTALFFSASCAEKPVVPVLDFKKESILLSMLPQTVNIRDLQFSPDGTEAVYRWKAPNGWQGFVFNGRFERYYDQVSEFLHYSRDGVHYAYRAKKGSRDLIVFDGTEGQSYDKVTDPVLSVTGRSVAYAAKEGEDAFVVFNDRRLGKKEYSLITPPIMSPDGKRVAYAAQRGDDWFYVVGEKEGRPYDEVGEGYFSRGGKTFAYEARREWRWLIVINGKESPEYDEVGVYPEVADAKVYTAKKDGKAFVVFRGKQGLSYDNVGWPAVSADVKHVAYDADKNGKNLVVFDGQEGKPYTLVGRPVFSPDAKEVAYDAVDKQDFLMVRKKWELRDFVAMPNPTFSPVGGKLAYSAMTHDTDKHVVVVEGVKGKEYDKVSLIAWSKDGKHLAYAAREGDKEFLVVDGREGKPFDQILSLIPRFSGDGKFVGANALKGNEVWWVVEESK